MYSPTEQKSFLRLFGQSLVAGDAERRVSLGSAGSWLAASDHNPIGARGHHAVAIFVGSAQAARIESEVDVLSFAAFQMNTVDSAERMNRGAWNFRETQISL